MDTDSVQTIVASILSGGVFLGIGTFLQGRKNAQKIGIEAKAIEKKLPMQLDSMILKGAEGTVVMMQAVNERLVEEMARHEAEYQADIVRRDLEKTKTDAHVTALESQITELRHSLVEANTLSHSLLVQLDAAHQQYARLEAEMQNYRN